MCGLQLFSCTLSTLAAAIIFMHAFNSYRRLHIRFHHFLLPPEINFFLNNLTPVICLSLSLRICM